jgi:hypothetical protein
MKNKIFCILICTLLIATSTVVTVSSIENKKTEKIKINEIEFGPTTEMSKINNYSTSGSFEQCVAACLGITLAGNCIYLVFGCAISPGPHNFCCWAVPIFCGVDISLLVSCIAKCAEISQDFNDTPPCFPDNIGRMIDLIQNSNSSAPAIILGLMCLLQKWKQLKEWMKEQGYQNIEIPDLKDCGCKN